MAVHTLLSDAEVARLARAFELGEPTSYRGLAAGSINSNYEVVTPRGRFFVTLREGKTRAEVELEVRLLSQLAAARFPAPRPISGTRGAIDEAEGRPVLCFPWIPGEELVDARITPAHLRELGEHLGRMHVLLEGVAFDRPNPYGPATVRGWLETLDPRGHAEVIAVQPELGEELARIGPERDGGLPRGVCHCDLFVDNVKWLDDHLSSIFDFEMACRDALALDLAITLNAWCHGPAGYDRPRVRALVEGYQSARPLSEPERAGLWAEARFGALRYTVSRIRDFELSPLPPERLLRKDFREYLARLRELRAMGRAGFRELCGV